MASESRHRRRGWRYTAAVVAARVVPESACRLRRFVVMGRVADTPSQIDQVTGAVTDADRPPQGANSLSIRLAQTETEIAAAESLTGYARTLAVGMPVEVPRVVIAEREGVIVGACWFTDAPFVEREMRLMWAPAPGQRWVFSSYVAKPWRGQGLYRQLLHVVATTASVLVTAKAPTHDHRMELLLSVNVANRRSVDVHRRLGFVERGTALGFHVFGRAALLGPLCRVGAASIGGKRYLRWSLPTAVQNNSKPACR